MRCLRSGPKSGIRQTLRCDGKFIDENEHAHALGSFGLSEDSHVIDLCDIHISLPIYLILCCS